MTGSGKAVVLAVGSRTLQQKEYCEDANRLEDEETPLQKKLSDFGDLLSKYAYIAAFFLIVILTLWQILSIMSST